MIGVAAGCGGSDPHPTPTTTRPAGSAVDPRGYLADSALAAQGIRGYLATLEGVAPEVTPVEARRIAPALQEDADRVALAFGRLSAGRLDDARLEEQRTAVTPILGELAKTMDRGAQAAAEGRTRQLVALLPALRTGLETLRTSLAAG